MRDAEGLCTRLPLCCGFVCPVAVLRQGIFVPYGRKNHMQTVDIADAAAFERTLRRLAHQILENNPEPEQVLLVGILRRGVPLAEELAGLMERFGGVRPPVETLDITLYRDDLSELGDLPEVRPTQFSTPVAGKTVILVDDVIYTGRTARAAMEAVIRLGRPARIRLAVMVDRGHRELPIDPEYVGKNVPTAREEQICVLTPQFDGQWGIHLRKQV
jgi:pyrimidine operon attenuation protein/uracil phosphoribosyltransferase